MNPAPTKALSCLYSPTENQRRKKLRKREGERPLTGPQAVGRIRGSEANPRATQPMEVPIVALSLPLALTPPPGGRRGPMGELVPP